MLSLLKHKLYAFPGYRIEMGGDSGGAPSPDPLVGQAAQRSADLAEKVYADNKGWLEELKPIIRDNMATQTAASKDAFAQSRIDRADYNTLGRPAIKQQAIGHGLARYVDDATANNLYDLYATREGLVSKAGDTGTAGSSSVVAANGVTSAGGSSRAATGTGGMISYNGKLYTPNEFGAGMVYRGSGDSPSNSNTAYDQHLNSPEALAAAKAAGYNFNADGTYTTTTGTQTGGSAASVTQSGVPAAVLSSSGPIAFTRADGTPAATSADSALKSINAWRGTSNKSAAANVQAQIAALQSAGYELKQDANGNYSFASTPQTRLATATAENDKAIWNAERGLEKVAVDAETRRAADDAGTDVTQAISKNNSMLERQGRGMVGFNPNKFARTIASNGIGLQNKALTAGAVNTARENARRGVVAMSDAGTANTINTTRGLPSQSMNWANTGQNQGNSAVATGMVPITANNQTTATALQGFGTAGQLSNAQYGNQLASYNAQQGNSSSGIGSVLGMAKMGMDIYTGGKSAKLW